MSQLYGIISNYDNAELITVLTIVIFSVAYLIHLWKNVGLLGRRFTTWEWCLVYFFGGVAFIGMAYSFAKLVFPERADSLMALLHADVLLRNLTVKYRDLLLSIIRLFI